MAITFVNRCTAARRSMAKQVPLLTQTFAVSQFWLEALLLIIDKIFEKFAFTATSDRVTYLTDSTEQSGEVNNAGFCLTYTQKKC